MDQIASKSKYFSYARKTVADKLVEAVQYLPEEYDFYVKEAYRALSQQTESFKKVTVMFPGMPEMDRISTGKLILNIRDDLMR